MTTRENIVTVRVTRTLTQHLEVDLPYAILPDDGNLDEVQEAARNIAEGIIEDHQMNSDLLPSTHPIRTHIYGQEVRSVGFEDDGDTAASVVSFYQD